MLKDTCTFLPDRDPEKDYCLVCAGEVPAKVGMLVRCHDCKKLTRHSKAEYTTGYYNHDGFHHYCMRCFGLNVREHMQEQASEIRAERLNEQALYKYEIESFEVEEWETRFLEWVKERNLPLEWYGYAPAPEVGA